MSRNDFVAKEQQKLQEERSQIAEELDHLRELMQAEVVAIRFAHHVARRSGFRFAGG